MVREVLEGLAARLAISNADEKLIRKMAKCIEDQKKVVEKRDLIGYSRLGRPFPRLRVRSERKPDTSGDAGDGEKQDVAHSDACQPRALSLGITNHVQDIGSLQIERPQ